MQKQTGRGIRSALVKQLLESWKSTLTAEELRMVKDWFTRGTPPVHEGPFPVLRLSPKLDEVIGVLLDSAKCCILDFLSSTSKAIYKVCVKVVTPQNGLALVFSTRGE